MYKWPFAVQFMSENEVIEKNVREGEKVCGQSLWDPPKKTKGEEEYLLNMLKDDCKGRKKESREHAIGKHLTDHTVGS